MPISLYISFRVSDYYLLLADLDSRNMLQCIIINCCTICILCFVG